ncbi:hypothetical protein CL689_06215 [Candidatus Saccharibacteria bacterium]|nr:hypothetical protein [Candidatus Saccharibacteria bacterium]|tara:strand:+ start:5216 stop:5596 length:381 start_codon:yes stop_codon:yes gene_type:complete
MKQKRTPLENIAATYSSEIGYVVKVRSREEAVRLGEGTRWSCASTVQSGIDLFPKYAKALYVACLKDGAKYQIHPVAGVLDASDQKVYALDIPQPHSKFLKEALKVIAKPELILNPQRNLNFKPLD